MTGRPGLGQQLRLMAVCLLCWSAITELGLQSASAAPPIARFHFADGSTIELISYEVDCRFGSLDTEPTTSFFYSPESKTFKRIVLRQNNGGVSSPISLEHEAVSELRISWPEDLLHPKLPSGGFPTGAVIQFKDGTMLSFTRDELSPPDQTLTKKKFVVEQELVIRGRNTQGRASTFSLTGWGTSSKLSEIVVRVEFLEDKK